MNTKKRVFMYENRPFYDAEALKLGLAILSINQF